jgi:hypothetical protein
MTVRSESGSRSTWQPYELESIWSSARNHNIEPRPSNLTFNSPRQGCLSSTFSNPQLSSRQATASAPSRSDCDRLSQHTIAPSCLRNEVAFRMPSAPNRTESGCCFLGGTATATFTPSRTDLDHSTASFYSIYTHQRRLLEDLCFLLRTASRRVADFNRALGFVPAHNNP